MTKPFIVQMHAGAGMVEVVAHIAHDEMDAVCVLLRDLNEAARQFDGTIPFVMVERTKREFETTERVIVL